MPTNAPNIPNVYQTELITEVLLSNVPVHPKCNLVFFDEIEKPLTIHSKLKTMNASVSITWRKLSFVINNVPMTSRWNERETRDNFYLGFAKNKQNENRERKINKSTSDTYNIFDNMAFSIENPLRKFHFLICRKGLKMCPFSKEIKNWKYWWHNWNEAKMCLNLWFSTHKCTVKNSKRDFY